MGFTNIDVNHIDIKLVFTVRLSYLQFPYDFSWPNRLLIWNLRHFFGQIKLSFRNFFELFLRMGFTNIDVNHIDIKLV